MTDKNKATGGKPVAGAENGTGGPISFVQHNRNGHNPQDGENLEALLAENLITPEQAVAEGEQSGLLTYTLQALEALADRPDGWKILPHLKPLIEQLNQAEQEKLNGSLYAVLKTGEAYDRFVESLSKPNAGPVFTPLSLADLLAMPPKEWLIDQVIGAQDMVMVYGPPGSGKTFLVIDLVLAACQGSQWAMRFDVTRPLSVAYCAGEGVSGLPARFAAAAEFRGIAHDSLPNFFFYKMVPQFYYKSGKDSPTPAAYIHRFITDWEAQENGPLDLLVVDTLHAASVGAEENSASDMGLVLQAMRYASNELGCAVLLVHHTNKAGSAERGSSALRGAMDAMISVKKVSEESTSTLAAIQCEKLKDGEGWKDQTFDLVAYAESVRVWWNEPAELGQQRGKQQQDKERIQALLKENGGQRLRATAVAEALGLNRGRTSTYLSELEQEKLVQRQIEKPDKPFSAHNPWVYFVTENEGKKGENNV